MSILRKHRHRSYTTVSNGMLTDARLSFRARGVLAYLLSKPDGWAVRRDGIAADGKEGRDAISSALVELRECGYYHVRVERGEDGQLRTFTDIFEVPTDVESASDESDNSHDTGDGLPGIGLPGTGLPDAGLSGTFVSTGSKDLNLSTPQPPGCAGGPTCGYHRRLGQRGMNCRGCGTNTRALARAARQRPKPPWCGACDETTRLHDVDRGVARCPDCHPLAVSYDPDVLIANAEWMILASALITAGLVTTL